MKQLLALLAIALLTACAGQPANQSARSVSANGLTVTFALSPDPPKQGPVTLAVTVKNANAQPVTGARVRIATNMPQMAMSGPTLTAKDNGDGTYATPLNLNYATTWHFRIDVAAAGKNMILNVDEAVK